MNFRTKDIVGQTFGCLAVVSYAGVDQYRCAMWRCRCTCGTERTVAGNTLRRGYVQSCEACASRVHDLSGMTFGRLLVIGRTAESIRVRWNCRCECGVEISVAAHSLVGGKTKSCGCLQRESRLMAKRTHGATTDRRTTPEYRSWQNMLARCTRPTHPRYADYGGRGITVSERWHSFEAFLSDMGPKPFPRATIERVNNSRGYETGNCIWATQKANNQNKRNCVLVTWNGETRTAAEWSKRTGLARMTIVRRIRAGIPVEQALTRPAAKNQFA